MVVSSPTTRSPRLTNAVKIAGYWDVDKMPVFVAA
jgi:hypothetical protein